MADSFILVESGPVSGETIYPAHVYNQLGNSMDIFSTNIQHKSRRVAAIAILDNIAVRQNKLQKLEDALRETGDTEETWDTGDTWDIGLTGSTVLRHDLTEIKPKMGNSNS